MTKQEQVQKLQLEIAKKDKEISLLKRVLKEFTKLFESKDRLSDNIILKDLEKQINNI